MKDLVMVEDGRYKITYYFNPELGRYIIPHDFNINAYGYPTWNCV